MAFRFAQDGDTWNANWYKAWTSNTGGGTTLYYTNTNLPRPGTSYACTITANASAFTSYAKMTLDDQSTWLFQYRFVVTSAPTGNSDIIKFTDNTGALKAILRYSASDGTYKVILGDGSTVFASVAYACPATTSQLLEFKIVFATGGLGSAILKINGRTVISQGGTTVLSGLSTANSIWLGNWSLTTPATNYVNFQDLIVIDGAGSSPTDFIGDRRVDAYKANANGTYQDMFRSNPATSAYQLVDDVDYADTDYVYSDTDGHKSTFNMANMSHTPAVIDAVQVTIVARRTDPGDANLKMLLKSGATLITEGAEAVTASYATYRKIYSTDPNTSTAWTVSGVNAIEAGIEVDIP